MFDVNEVKPDTRAELNQLFERIEELNAQVNALELPCRIEFYRLLRIAESNVEFISYRANELSEAKDELKQKSKAAYKAALWTMGIGLLYLIASNFYRLPSAVSMPFWLFIAGWYGKAVFEAWDSGRKLEKNKAIYSNYRLTFFSAGFSSNLLDAIAEYEKKEATEAFSDAYMLNDQQIELAIKTACFDLCQGIHKSDYRHSLRNEFL